ncbi:zinc finger protein 569-like [Esox lucius]|uniref:zinc finger protein 569-like n=1 Tax=Esox lucius TaxID=8010 RepID=UPI0014773818|nr:zinc finger protein 569-like [Esox lucius]
MNCVGDLTRQMKMPKLQSFRVFLNERLTVAAVEIFGAVEKTVREYHEEIERLRRLLQITPAITLRKIDSQQFSLTVSEEEVPPEQQHSEQEWSPSLGEEDPEPKQIKQEKEELRTSQEEEQLQAFFHTKDSIFSPPCVKSECDQEAWSMTLPQTQTVENRESDSRPVDLKPFDTVTHLKGLEIPFTPPNNLNNAFSYNLSINRHPVRPGSSPTLHPNPLTGEHCSKPSTCNLFNESIYTGENPLGCADSGRSFSLKQHLIVHKLTHTREKPFSCGDCGKRFNRKGNLTTHKLTHTGEKPFSCDDCGKSFRVKRNLTVHKLTHTGEKPFSCGDCGKRFSQKGNLTAHKRTHTGEKPFICGECGKGFMKKRYLTTHELTHTGVTQVSNPLTL